LVNSDIARLGLEGKAWLTPYSGDMPKVMNAIDCLVHPQIGTEAFGLVVCEAHACGKPVIAAALDGIPEAFATGGYGQLVAPESVEQLADAMRAWAGQPPASPTTQAALHKRIAGEYSLLAFGGRMLQLYRRLAPPVPEA
jgi:glycosyltransferase involved in cell wall biosynthesis